MFTKLDWTNPTESLQPLSNDKLYFVRWWLKLNTPNVITAPNSTERQKQATSFMVTFALALYKGFFFFFFPLVTKPEGAFTQKPCKRAQLAHTHSLAQEPSVLCETFWFSALHFSLLSMLPSIKHPRRCRTPFSHGLQPPPLIFSREACTCSSAVTISFLRASIITSGGITPNTAVSIISAGNFIDLSPFSNAHALARQYLY